jgi:hypothetical protein
MSNEFSPSSVRRLLLVAAASVGALGFIPIVGAADPDRTANEVSQTPALPAGFLQKDEGAADGVKSTLVQLTQRAVAKDSYDSFFSGFLSDLAARDKARAQEFTGVDQQHLNDVIGQIQTGWRAKYNQDFQVSDKNLVFDARFPIVEGEVSDPVAAANNWPVTASAAQVPSASASQQACNAKELTLGRAVALIGFNAADGMPEMTLSMIHQRMTGWYVDLPVDRTGAEIYADLSSHLTYIAAHQDNWPGDVNDGYRMVARNVAAALYGVSSPAGTASAQ